MKIKFIYLYYLERDRFLEYGITEEQEKYITENLEDKTKDMFCFEAYQVLPYIHPNPPTINENFSMLVWVNKSLLQSIVIV